MLYILFFIIGVLFTLIFTRKPIQIQVHHKYENINHPLDTIDMVALEEEMLKKDPKSDAKYEDLDEIMIQVNEIMGGSDR